MDMDALKNRINQRNDRYRRELEDWYRQLIVGGYRERAAKAWHRDYSGIEGYERSVRRNRERWRAILNPPDLSISGPLELEPVDGPGDLGAACVRLPLSDGLRAEGILAAPKSEGRAPLIVAQHGIDSQPEHVFGLVDPEGAYHSFGRRLVEAGFAVLAPMNLFGGPPRGRITRLAKLAGTTLPGLELVRMQRLLDAVLQRPDLDPERVGFWGLSLGGMAAQFWGPLEPRLRVIISAAWFNSRLNKMVISDPRYSCFLDTQEEHAFIHGWLTEFCDSDLLSLVCPRPFMSQTGKADGIAWWPQVVDEFNDLKRHYEQLGIGDRCVLDLHEGVHEVRLESGIEWLKRWL